MRTHLVIPDTQTKPGVPTDHLGWIGQYIVDQFYGDDLSVIHLGDHWDMPSLSSYDKGKRQMEGRRYVADIEAGNAAFARLCAPLEAKNRRHSLTGHGERCWWPDRHFLDGNHENRVTRAADCDASLDGLLSLSAMTVEAHGWQRHGFLEPVELDGVTYTHYFYNPMTGRSYGGSNLETRLKTIGHSFTMGHQQGLKWGRIDSVHGPKIGLIAGSCYLHDEEYLGPQGNRYWRGIVVCHEVEAGAYDPMFVSLNYLCRRYEGVTLDEFLHEAEAA